MPEGRTKIQEITFREFLFADVAAVAAHSEAHLQCLMDRFSKACDDFELTVSQKKTQAMGEGGQNPVSITIND